MKILGQLWLLVPLVMGIGIAMTIQTALNTQARQYLPSALHASLLSFIVGTGLLMILVWLLPNEKWSLERLVNMPWYLWCAGCLGVYAISISLYTAPKFGFLSFFGLVIFAQLSTALLIDHFGWLGVEKNPLQWQRSLGALLILLGALLTLSR